MASLRNGVVHRMRAASQYTVSGLDHLRVRRPIRGETVAAGVAQHFECLPQPLDLAFKLVAPGRIASAMRDVAHELL